MVKWLAFALLSLPASAVADSWMPPRPETVMSADRRSRVTLTPRALAGALPYFQDKVDGREPAGQAPDSPETRPTARVEHREQGRWQTVWEGPLVNDVGPLAALLTNGADRLVTFDNWHSVGIGDDVVVIYDARGRLVRKLALTDLVPEAYVDALPHTVSSLWWSGEHRLADDGRTLLLAVVVPSSDAAPNEVADTIDIRVCLADGVVTPPSGPAWVAAQRSAASVRVERERSEQERRAKRAAPALAPTSADSDAWREFMAEVGVRKYDGTGLPRALFLEPSGDRVRFLEAARRQLREAGNGLLVLASPDPALLADLLVKEIEALDRAALSQARVVFIGTVAQEGAMRRAVEGAGGRFEFVDMTKPVAGITPSVP